MNTQTPILVIDDEDTIADMVAEALRDEGFMVHVAYDGQQGFDMALAYRPALIMTDVMMPVMDGIQMIELLRRDLGAAMPRVVFMSAVDCRNQTQEYGTFIFKPFTLDTLFNTVFEILG